MAKRLAIKDTVNEQRLFLNRAIVLSIIMFLLFVVLLGRFAALQVLDYQTYQTRSEQNRIQIQSISPPRGLISDTKGELLAGNITVYNLAIVTERVDSLNSILEKLTRLVGINQTDIESFRQRIKEKRRPYDPVPLRFRLSEKEIAILATNRYQLQGVEITTDLVRFYPYGPLFAHSVGSVRRINERDLVNLDQTKYSATKYVGKIGIEKVYEASLHGSMGIQRVETDAHGRVRQVLDREPSKYGANLDLYLDVSLQAAAVRALKQKRGAIVAIDTETGGILAMVSKPSYDPNSFITGISSEDFEEISRSLETPLFNRATNGQYAPGSTFKPIVGLAGIASKLVTWQETVEDRGEFKLPNQDRLYRDWSWTPDNSGGQGVVDLRRAIYRSSNVYFYSMANRIEIDILGKFAREFGLGQNLAIDIPEANAGLMPGPSWKEKTKKLPWFPGDTVNIGIGQGDILVTPLQMALVASIFANRGRIVRPKMVKSGNSSRVESDREVVEGIDLDDWERMIRAMEDVVHLGNQGFRGNGTAWAYIGRDIPYRMAGKSGTAQVVEIKQGEEYSEEELKESEKNHAWFIAFAPVKNPKIAVAVLVENGGGGSSVAGPVARQVVDSYLAVN
ncbi:MAG: penicillin-binding protein 2 [Candidatus Azotimanducaceae bacterium]